MATKQEVLASLRETGVITVLRTDNPVDLVAVAEASSKGGIKFIEITMTIPGALDIIKEAVGKLKGTGVYIGAGDGARRSDGQSRYSRRSGLRGRPCL